MFLGQTPRSFNPIWATEGVEKLKGLPNLYCDTAAVGEVGAAEAIIQHLGHDRLLWGTDFPITHLRGSYVAAGVGFVWIGPESHPDKDGAAHHGFVHNGLEQLRGIKQAVWHQRLTDSQVEDVFFNNLAGLIDVN